MLHWLEIVIEREREGRGERYLRLIPVFSPYTYFQWNLVVVVECCLAACSHVRMFELTECHSSRNKIRDKFVWILFSTNWDVSLVDVIFLLAGPGPAPYCLLGWKPGDSKQVSLAGRSSNGSLAHSTLQLPWCLSCRPRTGEQAVLTLWANWRVLSSSSPPWRI